MRLTGVTREYGGGVGSGASIWTWRPAEIHALVGLNGAGKSTLMKLMLGMLRPDAGDLTLLGADVRSAGPDTWGGVGALDRVPAGLRRTRRADQPGVGGPAAGCADPADRADGRGRAGRVGPAPVRGHPRAPDVVWGTSNGSAWRRPCSTGPDLIILDEPTNALDPAGIILLREALLRRAADGAGVLVSSHHLDEVARIATRISVIAEGRMVGHLDPDGVDIERAFFALVHEATTSGAQP